MLILPPGHAQELARGRFSRRERWMVGSVLSVALALAVGVVIALATGGHASAHGCVEVNLPYSTGGQEIYRCGRSARELCATAAGGRAYSGSAAEAVITQCRKAGVPLGGA